MVWKYLVRFFTLDASESEPSKRRVMKQGDEWKDLFDEDMPRYPITDNTKRATVQAAESGRYRTAVRLATGRFWTDEEYEEWRRKVLSTPLP